ncbi:TetR/AcrR family transcriptional regulator [Euzebya tangerina]|uniref:TetR/AcrR family transcriptional regulator n=1 Tax=Euzebya tangerina TaxID=591198 RepID=UPI000E3116A2|nr:TetR/AcrR family transcriptional regulator [Euzebya tangerina]
MPELAVAAKGVETTRETVLRTATELFAEHGYHAVGIRSIADAVGVKPASLYHHFDSKAALLSEIAHAATSRFTTDALATLEGPGSPRDRLAAVLHHHIRYFHDHRQEEAITRRDMASLPPAVLDDIQTARRAYHQAVTAAITAGCAAGEFQVGSPALAAFAVLDAVNGINVWFRPDGPIDLESLADHYVTMALDGLLQSADVGRPSA